MSKGNVTYCPLCNSELEYRRKKARGSYIQTDTHAWFCNECPFIGFEYCNDNNYKDLKKLIK